MQNIILFGEMGSGKSTVAKYICNKYGYTRFSLGEKIHLECKLHGNENREELQEYGQMMRKVFGEFIWCDYVINKSKGIDKIIIDDGRQLNEYSYFTNLKYIPIAVIADKNLRLKRLSNRVNYKINLNTFEHDTEKQARKVVEMCNIKIYNNYFIDKLYDQIDKIIKGGI
jgi:dephospho-CoA kinase